MNRMDPQQHRRDSLVYSGHLREFIQELRNKRGLSQQKVSRDGNLGKEAIGRIERGEKDPSYSALLGVARGLGLTPERFFRLFSRYLMGRKLKCWELEGRYRSEDGKELMEIWKLEQNTHK